MATTDGRATWRRWIGALVRRAGRQLLHAWELHLAHPATGETMSFAADPPADLAAALVRLRRREVGG